MLDKILKSIDEKKNIFLTGGAGVGKSYTITKVVKHYTSKNKKIVKLASTGMAATAIGGQTLHSFLKIGIANSLQMLQKKGDFEPDQTLKTLISALDIVIIDEVSMISSGVMDIIKLRLAQSGFTGVLMVVGDFLQLPPINKNTEVKFAFESTEWENADFTKIELTHIYRTDDEKFIQLLHNVRYGYVDEAIHNHLNSYIKPLPQDLSSFTFLFGKNISASMHNKQQLSFIDDDLVIKNAQVVKHNSKVKDTECERFMNDSRIDKDLELKVGAPILFTRNSWNYFNGQRGIITAIDDNTIYVQKNDDSRVVKLEVVSQSKEVWVEKTVSGKKELVLEPLFTIYQYPIKLAFAITIHKSQGMSIEDLIIQTNEIFSPSQFYVALSRSSNPMRLNLIAPNRQWYELIYVNKKALDFVSA